MFRGNQSSGLVFPSGNLSLVNLSLISGDFYIISLICLSSKLINLRVLTTLTSSTISNPISAGAFSATVIPGIPDGASVATAVLLLLLLFRYFLPGSKHWENAVKASLNMGIIPLLFSFGAVILSRLLLYLMI